MIPWAWAGFMAVVVAREGEPVRIVCMADTEDQAWQIANLPGRALVGDGIKSPGAKRPPALSESDRTVAKCIRVDRRVSNDWYHGKGHLPQGKAVTIHPDGVLVYVERKAQ